MRLGLVLAQPRTSQLVVAATTRPMSTADLGRYARFYRPSMLTKDPWAGLKNINVKTVPVAGERSTRELSF